MNYLMNCINYFRKGNRGSTSGSFSEFFRNAPVARKKEIFRKAAEKANEDQRKVFNRVNENN